MSSREESESDGDGPEVGSDDESSGPAQRSTPEDLVGNTVTRIMPVIAAWPEPGAELPTLPAPRAVGAAPVVSRVEAADAPDVPATKVFAPGKSADVVRAGPAAIAEDSWDEPPASVLDAAGSGDRHVQLPSRRVWVALVSVLLGLGAVVGVPFVLSSQPGPPPEVALDESPAQLDEPPPGFVPSPTVVQSPAPMSTGESATPARSPSPTQGQAANTTPANTTGASGVPPFEPLTIEAETGTIDGTYARIWVDYLGTGVDLVRNLGNWGGTPGTVTLNGIVFPSDGDYTVTMLYVHPDGEMNRSAQLTVSGVEPAVTVNFVGSSNCCDTTAVTIFVAAGTRSITFSNPTSHAPSIDKVIISRG